MPTLTLDGRLVITPPPRKSRPISDIVHWAQAFSIYMFVLVSFFPQRATDLFLYNLLIVCTAAQFGGDAWRNYDEAFCCEAAACGLTDWSHMNLNFIMSILHITVFPDPLSFCQQVVRVHHRPFFSAPGTLGVVQLLAATVDIGMPVIISVVGAPIVASNARVECPRCHPHLAP